MLFSFVIITCHPPHYLGICVLGSFIHLSMKGKEYDRSCHCKQQSRINDSWGIVWISIFFSNLSCANILDCYDFDRISDSLNFDFFIHKFPIEFSLTVLFLFIYWHLCHKIIANTFLWSFSIWLSWLALGLVILLPLGMIHLICLSGLFVYLFWMTESLACFWYLQEGPLFDGTSF